MSQTDPESERSSQGDNSDAPTGASGGGSSDSGVRRAIEDAERAVTELSGGGASADESTAAKGAAAGSGLQAQVDALQAELVKAQASADDFRDKWVRSLADFENARKRSRRDIDEASLRAISGLLDDFFPVYDNLQRALATAGTSEGPLVTGIKMVQHAFVQALARHGVSPIESVGKPFDPAVHEALQQIDSPDHAPGVVVQEFEKGFVKGERLMRPARVIVAGPGSTGTYPEDSSEAGATGSGDASPQAAGESQAEA